MQEKEIVMKLYSDRDGRCDVSILSIPPEQFYRLIGVDGPDDYYEKLAPGMKEKIKSKYSEINHKASEANRRISKIQQTLDEANEILRKVEIAKLNAKPILDEMNSAIEKYKVTRREPVESAHSLAPESWQCSACGTVSGKLNLFGKDGTQWRKIPRFCPGCGAKNTDVEFGDIYEPRKAHRRL